MRLGICGLLVVFAAVAGYAVGKDEAKDNEKVFELRTYIAHDGKLDALHARFRDHTNKLFTKHGMSLVGYWTPTDGEASKNTLIYVLAHKSRAAADASWKAFVQDKDWQTARTQSEVNGPLVKKVERVYMKSTDYSPIQ